MHRGRDGSRPNGWVVAEAEHRALSSPSWFFPGPVFSSLGLFFRVEGSSSFGTSQRLLALIQDAFFPWDLSCHWGRNRELFPLASLQLVLQQPENKRRESLQMPDPACSPPF